MKAPFLLSKMFVPEIEKRGDSGSILFISSIVGLHSAPFMGPYSVSKTALLGLIKALSGELAPRGIRVNGIAPGIIKTKFAATVSCLLVRPLNSHCNLRTLLQLTENDTIAETMLEQTQMKRQVAINCKFVQPSMAPLYAQSQFRFGVPEDISGVASFLCSDDARYITGETVVASGGMPSRL